jgi:hypothetical protein
VPDFLKKIVFSLLVVACCQGVMLSFTGPASGQESAVEYKIKAAFLLNFAKFITWPEQTLTSVEQPFSFCVLGRDPFGAALTPLQARTVAGHSIRVRYLETPAESRTCQMLFITDSEKEKLSGILKELENIAVVTVSDIPGFVENGGIIEFVSSQGRLAFKINLAEAGKRHLRINASLLNLASEVIR